MKKLITSSSTLGSCLVALAMMVTAQSARAEYVTLTPLDGMLSYGQSSVEHSESYAKLVDRNINTKWGGWFDPALSDEDSWPNNSDNSANKMYIIVKAAKAVVPEWYFLVTGNDTGVEGNQGRNWASWKIYGGNFADDADAVRGGENWVLLDDKQDEPLPAKNTTAVNLNFDYTGSEGFQYFWIEIEKSVQGADVYLQMSEWGLGSYGDLEQYLKDEANKPTGVDEPVNFHALAGDPAGYANEGYANLFDAKSGTKWCCGFTGRNKGETTNGGYVIFKASRAMAPTYYSLTTSGDTQQYPDRNWKQWQIYGMNAASDEDVTRESASWELIDDKANVPTGTGLNQLPALNLTSSYFSLSEENTTEYRYFKVELDQIVGGGTMQMSDLLMGDVYTLILDRTALADAASAGFNPDLFAEKALLDQMAALIAELNTCEDPSQLGTLNSKIGDLQNQINASAGNYAELLTARNQAAYAIEGNNLTEEAIAYMNVWMSETDVVAPNDDYPVGNLAYIKANRQLTGAEAQAEANRINAYLINHAAIEVEPIYAVYQFLSGTTDNWNAQEGPESLIDGDRDNTKWGTATSGDRYLIFKSVNADTNENEPIQPTYYGLVTGGDTSSYPDRNWKNWKIFAANFDSDEEATKNSDKWVLIDEKNNVGTDILKTTSLFESYIYLSEGCAVPYTYFKIEVYQTGGMQMNEFTFYNIGNLKEYRESFISEFEDYSPDDYVPAYGGYINGYKEKYEELCNTVNAPDLMKIKNELTDMQKVIEESNGLYLAYEDVFAEIQDLGIESESLAAWQEGYTTENIAPCSKYIRGTHAYILDEETQLGTLDNDGIKAETDYLTRIYTAVNEELYILLGGHTVSEWGDGFYGNLIDGYAQDSEEKNEDGSPVYPATKWGGNSDANGNTYIIFRTVDKTNPFFYTLTTGNDTGTYTGRNWGTWYIYGANFEGDGDATKDAEGWVLIDSKENVGQDRLHPVNAQPSYFGFSTETTEEYIYYKVVVTKAYSGSQIQMNELHFGTEEEFDAIKDEYKAAAEDFSTDIVAQQELLDKYEATIPEIDECQNMEALFRVNYELETLREQITASANAYADLNALVEDTKTYLEENALTESEALTKLVNYITTEEEPSETYPNGTFAYIYDEHVLADSVITAEVEFLQAMRAAAVAAGYGKGMEISDLIVNRTFEKAGEMLKDEKGVNIGREAEGWDGYVFRSASAGGDIYAAEFCDVNAKFNVSQTIANLKNGFYKVTLNAAYRANGDEKMLSYNYAAMAYANDIATYVPVLREDAAADEETAWTGSYADKQIYSADSTETYGYGVWGCEGAANAFEQGRFAITMVAKVTDGTLTIGVKNEGTKGNEWTGVGNFALTYLGEEEADAAEALAEVAEYNAARINTLTELYKSSVDELEDYSDAPNFGAAQKATLAANSGAATYEAEGIISETMKNIYDTKQAYIALFGASQKVYEKWSNYSDAEEDAVYAVRDNLDAGAYDDAEAALAAKAQLYAEFPDYLEMTGNGKVGDLQQEEFGFNIVTTGARPFLSLHNIYEPLADDAVILTFEYTAKQNIENGFFYYETPNLVTDVKDAIPTLPATEEWTKVYYNVSKAVKVSQFGSAVDHGVRWYINYNATADDVLELGARNFRIITKAQMKAEGGKPLNGTEGDLNGDDKVDIADAVSVLNLMAAGNDDPDADLNGDGKVDIADFVSVLNLMAQQ